MVIQKKIRPKYIHTSKDKPIKKHEFKSGQPGNPSRRPKGSLNRKKVAMV